MNDFSSELEAVPGFDTEAETVADLAFAASEPSLFDPAVPQGVIVPRGAQLVQPDLSAWRERPVRKTGTYRPATVDALAAFVGSQEIDGDTTVWVHPTSGLVTAVIDDNGDEPGYGQHRAVLQLVGEAPGA